ncbi:hypothetical protein BROC_01051 [Candidatus Brocadiaceae bacterium]|nr:hypothetical protein BROC_01051 [Candidatus Brocadiaceae bacterium]
MAFREQAKILDELKRQEFRMAPKDLEAYKMFVKRQKDDEDFDSVSMRKLTELYEKYRPKKNFSDFDKYFKKPDQQ